jgi:RNA polymerase sigma factor (sigma-70 family)
VREDNDHPDRQAIGVEAFFLQELETIERAIRVACRRAGLKDPDAEDFGSYVSLRLIENDYAIVQKFEGRCSFGAYVHVVVQRFMLDYRIAAWGRWHASAEAKRFGDVGVAIESMTVRDGWAIDEALPALLRRWPDLTRERVESIFARLPRRAPRARFVDAAALENVTSDGGVQELASEADRLRSSRRLAAVVREVLERFAEEDRLLFRLRFQGAMSIAEISRMLATEQKPLYRRVQRLLTELRSQLRAAGFDAADAEDILSSRCIDLDFGFDSGPLPMRPPTSDPRHRTGGS